MRKLFLPLILLSSFVRSQDTLKLLNHEVGVNVVGLIKQTISNTPTVTIPQLPYVLFYNIYYRDQAGLRLGAGYNSSYSETEIPGQVLPRVTDQYLFNLRAGATYNFVRSKRLALNCFVDYIFEKNKTETINTTTVQVFPNPRQTITTETSETTRGEGAQAGVGIRFNLLKHLSLYTEVPVTFITRVNRSKVLIDDTGEIIETSSGSRVFSGQIFLPSTIYLLLRF